VSMERLAEALRRLERFLAGAPSAASSGAGR